MIQYRLFHLFVSALVLVPLVAAAQVADDNQPPAQSPIPRVESLETGWWSYFEGQPNQVATRIDAFLDQAGEATADLPATDQVDAESVLAALRTDLDAYRALQSEENPQRRMLEEALSVYSIDELLNLAATQRSAAQAAIADRLEVERAQQSVEVVAQRRDNAFKTYIDTDTPNQRWFAGLRLVQSRAALAIAERRLQLLSLNYDGAIVYADALSERLEAARGLVSANGDDSLDSAATRVAETTIAVTQAEATLREAQVAALGLDLETAQARARQRLQRQTVIDAEVQLGLARVELAKAQSRLWWTQLQLDTSANIKLLSTASVGWAELVRASRASRAEWKRDTEDELLAAQTVVITTLDRPGRALLTSRQDIAQNTLKRLSTLDDALNDLELLTEVVDDASARYSGPLKSALAKLNSQLRSLFTKLAGFTDFTLFEVGETPVTVGDLVQILVILFLAVWLSRGVRHALARMRGGDSSGTKASLYTVGRLAHYVIIISALLIALASIGLDFGNLALVAGALGVGIGFGLQSIVSNFVSGLIILFEQSLRVGDYIELDKELTGTVKSINVRSTLITTNDNIDIVVPNSEFVNARLTNWTLGEKILRVRIPFGVAYGSDKELVRKAAIEAALRVPYTLTHMKGREPDVWLVEYGDSSLNFLLLVWVNRQGAKRPTRTRAAYLWELETALNDYNIEIPFPQRDLHIRTAAGQPIPSLDNPPVT
ncbi:MAG: mechanosensitive ion channel domain-containing protein [Gammaproteobacteria bacterium]